ncbi:MAG: TaqI-like C-terminal specificity domain-containing protein [Candidatus Methanoperedens sp.]|nr:TaqI-like C-terminal specificity domain-containing protein [Candidatus Methanoperedens sp.]
MTHTTTVYSFVFKEECQENILFWNSILNSSLLWYFISNTGSILRGGFFRFKTNYLKPFPIRRISFTTPPDRRAALLAEAKAMYSEFLGALNSQKILDFVRERLSAAPEESDVVHDLLAFLAERMIEMNKEKNAEIKSFLDFLKGEIGAPIEELSNKTAIQEYYKNEFQKLIDVLVKNKKKLRAGYDPKSPANYKHLLEWYKASVDKLKPLMGRIEATDRLIDQIVYKLYGLTKDEIKIVEESISGEKTHDS